MRRIKSLPLFASATSPELRTWQWLAIVGGGIALALPVDALGFSLCFFYNLTGVPCPGCGMTRSVHHALLLNPTHAFYHHPMGLFAAAAIVFFWITALWAPAGPVFERNKKHTARALSLIALMMILFGVARAAGVAFGPVIGWRMPEGFDVVLQDQRLDAGAEALWRSLRGIW